ncbi:MAG: sulfatase-like hydrolase/transferase [Fuerstiella sp.]|nr:sulfatase-like hydrolase/transferase [Fuerstiella sp.]MCP4511024.1 sulfatase-like hydrolase/transferase [Fuerstiella sp.]
MNINRLTIVVALFHLSVGGAATAVRPNIVVILTDDQGYADISLNPHQPEGVSTPHMDALAKDGVVFSQGYTSGHVCSPTRAGLMLGQYQQRVGVYSAGDGGARI